MIDIAGDRTEFNDTWLFEMPSGKGIFPAYEPLINNIKEVVELNESAIQKLAGGLNKLQSNDVVFYWYGDVAAIELGSELVMRPQGLVVRLTGKNPALKGKAPFASDLYSIILKDAGKNIRLLSDIELSDEGYDIWKTLLKRGHKVSVYDAKQPGVTRRSFDTIEQMDEYFKHDDKTYHRYRYVLSESTKKLLNIVTEFNIRRHRELAGLSLIDYEAG